MTVKAFSMTDALKHGMAMTLKHFGFVAIIIVIYIAYSFASGMLEAQAGKGEMPKSDAVSFYGADHKDKGEAFYAHLQAEGYISSSGAVLPKLADLRRQSELTLPENMEDDRNTIFRFLMPYTYRLPFPKVVYWILALILWVIEILMQIGLIKISIMLSRDEEPAVAELFANPGLIIPFFLSGLCFGIAVVGGFILLIIPGFIVMVMLGMYSYFIVDQHRGPIEALKASRELTRGARWQLFLFGWLVGLFNLAGILCLFIGVLFTLPASGIAYAYVYDKLRGAEPAESEEEAEPEENQPA